MEISLGRGRRHAQQICRLLPVPFLDWCPTFPGDPSDSGFILRRFRNQVLRRGWLEKAPMVTCLGEEAVGTQSRWSGRRQWWPPQGLVSQQTAAQVSFRSWAGCSQQDGFLGRAGLELGRKMKGQNFFSGVHLALSDLWGKWAFPHVLLLLRHPESDSYLGDVWVNVADFSLAAPFLTLTLLIPLCPCLLSSRFPSGPFIVQEEEAETQRKQGTCLQPHSRGEAEPGPSAGCSSTP